jgi:hypothetical protein
MLSLSISFTYSENEEEERREGARNRPLEWFRPSRLHNPAIWFFPSDIFCHYDRKSTQATSIAETNT